METNTINTPFDIDSINKTAEDIAMKQIEIEAEKIKLHDLSEVMRKIKESTSLYLDIANADYTEKWYDALVEEKQSPSNNADYTGKQNVA